MYMKRNLLRNMNILSFFIAMLFSSAFIYSCSPAKGDRPGHEYMMDMGHSIAYEANTIDEFYYNRWNPEQYYKLSQPRTPVEGTVPRGDLGISKYYGAEMPENYRAALQTETMNGYVPYYYKDTEAERLRAIKEIINNPLPISKANLDNGKKLFNITCAICHGEKGDGAGYLVRDGGKYPAQPANLVSDDFINSSNGRYYHAIMYGKNMMGSYADRLSYEERWQVIQYIRSMQATVKSKVYNETENTFNTTDFVMSQSKKMRSMSDVLMQPDSGVVTTKIHVGQTIDSTKSVIKKK